MEVAIIHIADIHFLENEPEGVSRVIKAFIRDLKDQVKKYSDYKLYLSITGDIVKEGQFSTSYDFFMKEFDEELNKIGLTKDVRMVVPGNHNLDRNIILKNKKGHLKRNSDIIQSEKTFNNHISDDSINNNLFENYLCFESDFAEFNLNFKVTGNGHKINDEMGVYCLNTALCSLGGIDKIDDRNNLAIDTRSLIEWTNTTTTKTNILLMHHPLDYLNEWSKKELQEIIEENFALCLCGHVHEQDLLFNKISQNSLICSSPQLYTRKNDNLGYSIIFFDANGIDKIHYRQYFNNKFLVSPCFADNDYGIVKIKKAYEDIKEVKNIEFLEKKLNNSLSFFNNQPEIFVKRKISNTRAYDTEDNFLDELIINPKSVIINAQPQFGLTCLSHYMILEAYRNSSFWIYIDTNHSKLRNISKKISEKVSNFDKQNDDVKCIILDSWDSSNHEHCNILKSISSQYRNIPIIIMSSYTGFSHNNEFDFTQIERSFITLHLQAFCRNDVRSLVSKYNTQSYIADEEQLVSTVVRNLEAINIHRTPLNCYTLLKVLENNYNETFLNRTKMIRAVLIILFTDLESFTYSSVKPDVDDVETVLGSFCIELIKKTETRFKSSEFRKTISTFCETNYLTIDIEVMISVLLSNNILLEYNDYFTFKHSYWIYYFAATNMLMDDDSKNFILKKENYVNYPEIIDFFTGLDGRREEVIKILKKDTEFLTNEVNSKIGISNDFNPFKDFIWNPNKKDIEALHNEVLEKVNNSDLPLAIKDQKKDKEYNSIAPYNQSISNFFKDYKVLCLMQSITASSRALRNSKKIKPELKLELLYSILNGWEQISRVIFWISPKLAIEGKASFDGFSLIVDEIGDGTFQEKLKSIFLSNPLNVVNYLKDDISSTKIGKLFYKVLDDRISELYCHFVSLYLIKEKPENWCSNLFRYMNLLHKNSFYLGDIGREISNELTNGFTTKKERLDLNKLKSIIVAKHKYASKSKIASIPVGMTIHEKNKLHIDKILAQIE